MNLLSYQQVRWWTEIQQINFQFIQHIPDVLHFDANRRRNQYHVVLLARENYYFDNVTVVVSCRQPFIHEEPVLYSAHSSWFSVVVDYETVISIDESTCFVFM